MRPMPVDGYEHKHLWLYRSKSRYPWPLRPILEPDWDELDRDWEFGLVDRLQRGAAAPHVLALGDLISTGASSVTSSSTCGGRRPTPTLT
jgi:hypothetical protein